ncbi:bifunctional short chain isoprenyl diphosphate synthase [Campylobacter sputorum subsp. bubulus]|uniref:Bifunctional short chain isoprenyl diphosphate synthase n=1 Tax=Campylobacter sputorum subsp. sputorum TaxID=32024 RepID=A0A381DGU0_9BACT|nr:polyprenyl synthetase family protein [Campylobacter sputorum]ASM34992.1 octaprenyl-diphosphate synthase [Campylobacter sputorum aubsp. sputorum RM3237]KAB0581878.1 polyprenyl synthetase family protein [Campylobacter sputorum subsp. sputorum]QEL05183.1 octaprenyl-diphosphate synthase [Campylobacter sputorum subsp. sputorum]SUX09585.1 bifunctional short chain isoprenyl diphosphate synthase [Campylobacter sputorum subsp. sputorum]SUX30746.1 bifunctional short chain isoprenyl diphosphate syntha
MDKIDTIITNMIKELDYEPLNEMFANINSGKKLRSKLLLKIATENENSLKLCAIIELIHAASLLHDDVIDESYTRRGKASINAIYGAKNAIMLGDILYSKGYFELSKFDNFISQNISNAVSLLSIGEIMDVSMGEEFNQSKQKYLKMIYYKTAVLIEATAKCGAYLGKFDIDDFAKYGKNLGIAFQIIDDILDVTQDSKTLGKPALNDYKEGKTTLPYIYLYEKLNDKDKKYLISLFKKDLKDEEQSWIKENLAKFNIIEKCLNVAKNYGNDAINSVKKYNIEDLENIVKSMIDRTF